MSQSPPVPQGPVHPRQPAGDPRLAQYARPGDLWASIGKPLAGIGAMKARLDRVHLYVESGTLSTNAQQVPLAYVQDVDAMQTMSQKMRGVGTIRVHVLRPGGHREVMVITDLPDFRQGVDAINHAAAQARSAERVAQQTVRYQGAPMPQMPMPVQQPAPQSGADDVMSQLERLGKLRESGVLTDQEFQAKKADLLRRL